MSAPKGVSAAKPVEESYTTDDFEDVSMSGSGSKKLDLWSGKTKPISAQRKVEDSLKSSTSGLSASNSKSIGELKSNSRIGESSDVYDEDDFESMTKSHKEMEKVLPTVKRLETLKSMQSKSPSPPPKTVATGSQPTIAQTYARKENKQTMTD